MRVQARSLPEIGGGLPFECLLDGQLTVGRLPTVLVPLRTYETGLAEHVVHPLAIAAAPVGKHSAQGEVGCRIVLTVHARVAFVVEPDESQVVLRPQYPPEE